MTTIAGRGTAHTPRVVVLCTLGVLLAFLLQTALLPAVGASAAVPVVFAFVALLGVALGPRVGAVAGFLAGLLLDLTGVGTLGVGALLGCLLGAAAARIRVDRWWLSGVPSASLLVVLTSLAFGAGNAALAGLPVSIGPGMWWTVLGAVLCTALLLPARGWVREVVR